MKTIVPTEPTWDLWKGNALELLKKVPDNHFHTIVTSIPYWQPASQALSGMVGKEPTLKQYLGHCVLLARESKRVLRQDGTMWLNLHSGESAATIESDSHVISHSLPDEYRTKVAQAMSEVWSGHESPESSMQKLLAKEAQEAAELCKTKLRKVRGKVHDSQVPDSQRSGRYCSRTCARSGSPTRKRRLATLHCPTCGKAIERRPSEIGKGKQGFCSAECWYAFNQRDNNALWTGGQHERMSPQARVWRKAVLQRDKHHCRICHSKRHPEAHHILPFGTHKAQRWLVSNGITLCHACHLKMRGRELQAAKILRFMASIPLVLWRR